ncbi:MAG: bifunctional riboflavin kinase/FAD synthetase [Chitinophagales bacterium]|jgi:riboflavin kinase/FMN adenylyltransferase|nr:bifunctional riboflavin kinase/FAD synthetase [Chitinophagales bacterium]
MSVLTIGAFDGVHLGHQEIFRKMKQIALNLAIETRLITFSPYPRVFFDSNFPLINSLEENKKLIASFGIDHCDVFSFHDICDMPANDFVAMIFERFKPTCIVLGFDHRFGKDRAGSIDTYRAHINSNQAFQQCQLIEIDEFQENELKVSSTRIRKHLLSNELKEASQLLGYPFFHTSKVVKGQQLGSKLGFPTANFERIPNKIVLPTGVYHTQTHIQSEIFASITNIGYRPTVSGKDLSIETHILNFDKNLYGHEIQVDFLEFLRPERKFDHIDDLKLQIISDIDLVKKKLGKT